jgi:hypothetical protein
VNRKALRLLYSDLSSAERFRLVVRAGASGDDSEAAYLVRGCPTMEGTAPDPEFTGFGFASFRLVSEFARSAGPYLGWLSVVETLEALLTGKEGLASVSVPAHVLVALTLDGLAEGAARRFRDLVDAFEEVSVERAGLPSRMLLQFWVPPTAAYLTASEHWIQGLDSEPAHRERFRARLEHAWTLEDPAEGA